MAYNQALTDFSQQVYLTTKNRYFDDIASADGQIYIEQVMDWANLFFDELENMVDPSGNPVVWNYLRKANYEIGSATEGATTITLTSNINSVIASPKRQLLITVDGEVVSRWSVASPDQLNNQFGAPTDNMVVRVGQELLFSRTFTADEDGGTITADVVINIPRLSETNTQALTIVKPKQLLVLGVAKNATLPDIVQGGLSPSYVQKYNDLIQSTIARNQASSLPDTMERDNYSYISGVGF